MFIGKHTTLRKCTALLLLLAVLFIHGVKLFHHHTTGNSSRASSWHNYPAVAKAAELHCAICEFQFARDADNTVSSFTLPDVPATAPVYVLHIYAACCPAMVAVRLRGPPVAKASLFLI